MRDEWINTEERDEEILIRAVHTNFRTWRWLDSNFVGADYEMSRP